MSTAIERLRETISFLFTYHDKEPYQKVMADLAAVEALHQAAKAILGSDESIAFRAAMVAESPEFHGTDPFYALAAAVSRVEGTA